MAHSKKIIRIALAVGVIASLLITGVALAAQVLLDSFDAGSQNLVADPDSTVASGVNDNAVSLEGERDALLEWLDGEGEVTLQIDRFNSNRLQFATGDGVNARATITWDGNDGDAETVGSFITPIDLTDNGTNDGFHIEVPFDDLAVPVIFNLFTIDGPLSYTLNLPGNINSGNHVDFFIPFYLFDVDYLNILDEVTAVQIVIDASTPETQGVDVSIDFMEADNFRDYSDAPASYGIASHLTLGTRLGPNVDTEASALTSATASGDDQAGVPAPADVDDEDGVRRTPGWFWVAGVPGANTLGGSIDIIINGCATTCYLFGYIDWDQDGTFEPAEIPTQLNNRAVTNSAGGSWQTIRFTIPTNVNGSPFNPADKTFFARFRLYPTSQTVASPTGEAFNGEVEDYMWSFGPTAISLTAMQATSGSNQVILLAGAAMLALVLISGAFLARRYATRTLPVRRK